MAERSRRSLVATTLWGGAGIGAGGLVTLVMVLVPLPGAGVVLSSLASLLVLLGAVVLTVPPGSVVPGSRVGSAALVVVGASGVLGGLLDGQVANLPAAADVIVGTSLVWLTAVASVVTAITVWRARVLAGFARWVFVLPAAAYMVCAVLGTVPLGGLTLALTSVDIALAIPLSLLLTGVALIGFGRWSAVRRRAGTIDAAWRSSTSVGAARETSSSGERPGGDRPTRGAG